MRKLMIAALFLALSTGAFAQISSNGPVIADYGKHITAADTVEARIAKEVRHELLMLPWYSLFDDLEYTVQGRTVTLSGYVTGQHAGTKSDAENVVKQIEGVDKVINNIKVLPPSPMDDSVRRETYEALYRTASLSRYFWEAAPSLHIIVDNQRVTLKGIVNSEGDKNLATIAANGVPGVFQVTNDLRVVK
ncbi:MAG TPA: BON domain-containing protein [Candidatus Eisenbacteria bacterium]|nr:BON domain-containing protein [Candidatus Eisenbacteria bacterium]